MKTSGSRNIKAIILNRQDYKEFDSLVSLYSLQAGRQTLLARGTKKSGSKLAGHIEPLTLADVMVISGRGFDYLGSAITRKSYPGLRADLNKLFFAGSAINIFSRLVQENEPDKQVFDFLLFWLGSLDSLALGGETTKEDGQFFWSFFVLQLMSRLGYRPELYKCLRCGQALKTGGSRFQLLDSGLVCSVCLNNKNLDKQPVNHFFNVSDNCIKLARFFTDDHYHRVLKLRLEPELSGEIYQLTKKWLECSY